MENEVLETQNEIPVINLTPTVKQDVTSLVKWGRFFAYAGFVMTALTFILALVIFFTGKADETEEDIMNVLSSAAGVFAGVMYLIISLIYGVLSYMLLGASSKLRLGLQNGSQDDFSTGIHKLKNFITAMGIMMIIFLSVMLVSILGTVVLQFAVTF